jgi:hypothetical protein
MAFTADALPAGSRDGPCLLVTEPEPDGKRTRPSLEPQSRKIPLQRRRRAPSHTPIAALIRRRVNGNSRIRTPVASASALPMAAAVGPCADSPVPKNG